MRARSSAAARRWAMPARSLGRSRRRGSAPGVLGRTVWRAALAVGVVGGAVAAAAPVAGATATAPTVVPCGATPAAGGLALAGAISKVAGTAATIQLTAGCTYAVGGAGFTSSGGGNGPDAFAPVGAGQSLTIEGAGATITAAGATSPLRFFEVDAGGTLSLSDLTLTGGNDASGAGGGAVWNDGTLHVDGVKFADDTSVGDGGAIANGDGVGPAIATVTDAKFKDDAAGVAAVATMAGAADGGAIANGDRGGGSGQLTVSESTFTGDTAGVQGSTATNAGGAIESGMNGATGSVSVTDSTFDGDAALGANGMGGAIASGGGDMVGEVTPAVPANVAGASFEMTTSTLEGNQAATGAAMGVLEGDIVASTVAGNTVLAGGGGGALFVTPMVTLAADLVAQPNSPGGMPTVGAACAPVAPTDGGANLASDPSCGFTATSPATGSTLTSRVVANLADDLYALSDNRFATTWTMALVLGTGDPAIGVIPAGTPAPAGVKATYPMLCPRTDQTGYATPASTCAVGAYEPSVAVAPPQGGGGPSTPSLPPAFYAPVTNSPGVPVPLVVTPPTLKVVAPDLTVPYGSPLPAMAPTYSGFASGDTAASLTTPATCTTTATVASPVGTYPIVCAGAVDPRYTFVYVAGTLHVIPAPLVVRAPSRTVRYGSAPGGVLSPTYVGLVNGDTAHSLTRQATCATPARRLSRVGTYAVRCRGAVDANYAITYVPGRLRVVPGVVTVTGPTVRARYGVAPPDPAEPTYAGFVKGQGPASLRRAATCTTMATAGSPVGAYAIRCHGAASPDDRFRYVPGTLVVTPAPLVVQGPDRSARAGSPLPALPATYAGLVHGDTPGSLSHRATCSTPATRHSPAGRYVVTCTGASGRNYAIRYVPGRLVLAAPIPHAVIAGSAGLAASGPGLPLPASAVDAGRVPRLRRLLVVPSRADRAGHTAHPSSVDLAGQAAAGGPPTHVTMPSIGLDAPVQPVGDPGGVLYPPPDIHVIGWWDGGPPPGSPTGTSVLVGHVDGRNAAGVPVTGALFYLDRAPLGSTVVVRTASGRTIPFVLVARRLYTKTALPVRQIFTSAGPDRLVVVTCGGAFDPATRHYQANVVAYFVPLR